MFVFVSLFYVILSFLLFLFWIFVWFLCFTVVDFLGYFLVFLDLMNIFFVIVLYCYGLFDKKGFFFVVFMQWVFVGSFLWLGALSNGFLLNSWFGFLFTLGLFSKLYIFPYGCFYSKCLTFFDSFSSGLLFVWFSTLPFLFCIFSLLGMFTFYDSLFLVFGFLLFIYLVICSCSCMLDLVVVSFSLSAFLLTFVVFFSSDLSFLSSSFFIYILFFMVILVVSFSFYDMSLFVLDYYFLCLVIVSFLLLGFHVSTFWKFSLLFDFMVSSSVCQSYFCGVNVNFVSFVMAFVVLCFPLSFLHFISSFLHSSFSNIPGYVFSFTHSHFICYFSKSSSVLLVFFMVLYFFYLFFPFIFDFYA